MSASDIRSIVFLCGSLAAPVDQEQGPTVLDPELAVFPPAGEDLEVQPGAKRQPAPAASSVGTGVQGWIWEARRRFPVVRLEGVPSLAKIVGHGGFRSAAALSAGLRVCKRIESTRSKWRNQGGPRMKIHTLTAI